MTKKYQLKNGMNVILIESHKSPVVSIQMWVKTGSADEKKGVEGISHFIEHLVFKGSEKFGVGEIASAVEGAGGVLNAYTTFDQTVFYVTLSKDFTDTGLDVISEMMGRPRFDKSEIDNEREVVIEEIKRSLDSPNHVASRHLFSSQYVKHAYGVPVIGYDDNIRRVSREKIVEYYNARYVPQNMNLVVVGDFKSAEMQKKITEYFGQFKKYKLLKVKRAPEPKRQRPSISIKETPYQENFFYITWPMPGAKHPDSLALSLFAAAIGQGESSRLYQKLRNEKHLVNSISASLFSPKEAGFFAIAAMTNKERVVSAANEILGELAQILDGGITPTELQKALRSAESDKYFSMETVDGLAGLYGHFEFLYNDFTYLEKYLKKSEKLTCKKVIETARKYLQPNKMSIILMTNGNAIEIKKSLSAAEAKYAQALKAKRPAGKHVKQPRPQPIALKLKKNIKALPAQRVVLPNGARLVFKPIKGSTVMSARFGFLGGVRYENTIGANELATRVWPAGSKARTEADINHEMDWLTSGFGAFGGRNSIGLSMTTLVPNAAKTFDVLRDVLLNPTLPPEIIQREKMLMTEQVKSRRDKPASRCQMNFLKTMFPDHPYGHDTYGEIEDIEKLNQDVLRNHLAPLLKADNLVISLVGDISTQSWLKKLGDLEKSLASGKFKKREHKIKDLLENKYSFEEMQKEQSHLLLAYPGIKIGDKKRYALDLMQSILSGQGGRLFIELRDKASLAYSVAPMRMDGLDGGYFGAYIACSPDKVDRAVEMMKIEFKKLVNDLVSGAELERSCRYLIGRHDIALQRTGHIADLMLFDELYGAPFNEHENYKQAISQVTPDDIRRLAQSIFAQKFCLSVAGKKNVSI